MNEVNYFLKSGLLLILICFISWGYLAAQDNDIIYSDADLQVIQDVDPDPLDEIRGCPWFIYGHNLAYFNNCHIYYKTPISGFRFFASISVQDLNGNVLQLYVQNLGIYTTAQTSFFSNYSSGIQFSYLSISFVHKNLGYCRIFVDIVDINTRSVVKSAKIYDGRICSEGSNYPRIGTPSLQDEENSEFKIISPIENGVEIIYKVPDSCIGTVLLLDVHGRVIWQNKIFFDRDKNRERIPLENELSPGIYYINVLNIGEPISIKAVKH